MTKPVFATVYYGMGNMELAKDPGMIPYTMEHSFGYHSRVICSADIKYDYIDDWYDIEMVPVKGLFGEGRISRCFACHKWIKQHAKEVDVLHVYTYGKRTWWDILTYQKRNPNGLTYVHCDDSSKSLNEFGNHKVTERMIDKILRRRADFGRIMWGIQDTEFLRELKEKNQFQNICYMPDGFFWMNENKTEFSSKENRVITVGRIGTSPKRTDVLLKGFALAAEQIPDWKLEVVGPVEEGFRGFLGDFLSVNKDISDRIEIVGPIYDRDRLKNEYDRAKVFCLTSDWESFGIVQVEAASRGCILICSDIAASRDIVKNCGEGVLFKKGSEEELALALIRVCNDNDLYSKLISVSKNATQHYAWKNIVRPLNEWIMGKWNE